VAQIRDQAILLRRTPYGESSLVAQLLTEQHGRVHVIAKGAYRPTSRFYCVLDLFDTLDVGWSHSPRRELQLLSQGDLALRRKSLRTGLDRYRAALAMVELCELAARPGAADQGLYKLLAGGLDVLAAESCSADLVLVVFELAFLQNLGLAPALEHCAACGGPAQAVSSRGDRAAFSAGAGGRLCRNCGEEARASGRRVGTLPVAVLGHAAELSRTPRTALGGVGLNQDQTDRVRDFVERFMDYHLETRPRMHREFLSVSNRNAPTP
jgi:DNA repair protein RecO (recombination protein O)